MTIQIFEPLPPKVIALQLQRDWSIGEAVEKLCHFPMVEKVVVEAEWQFPSDDPRFFYTLHLRDGYGEPVRLEPWNWGGDWLVGTFIESGEAYAPAQGKVEVVDGAKFERMYKPLATEAKVL